jgi:hypothetical protein
LGSKQRKCSSSSSGNKTLVRSSISSLTLYALKMNSHSARNLSCGFCRD